MSNLDIYQEERPWGHFRQFVKNLPVTVKIISVKPNEALSVQSHEKRSEFWHVLKGDGFFLLDGEERPIVTGEEVEILTGVKHSLRAGEVGVEILEISSGDFDEKDEIRYQDRYGRK
ncbi:MAG: phosphomannose isomerase type II C-terminal cupin domain [Candidatus Paceibacterota bacterium]|jgi:mannose-6-phosphate isomerase-like protein (cupin superfamily)